MKTYNVITTYELGGESIFGTKAQTPYDAAEKATTYMSRREKERITKQTIIILDGSKKYWIFEK